nr:hypothetical protein [Tanacetum cinerariifolium]
METSISASPTPTIRIHKDHPKSQIINPVDTPIQTTHNEARLISKRVANQEETPSLDNILSLTNRFEDILRVSTSSDETIGVEANNVWTLVDCPKGVRPIGTKWVLKNKKDERGIIVRNKAMLVAQGHTQEEGIDYDEVFAPVARIEAIRLFLAYASFMSFTVYQMDVKSAFLYGTIDEEEVVTRHGIPVLITSDRDPRFAANFWRSLQNALVKVVATARRLEMPLPEVCTAIEEKKKKRLVKDRWQLH